MLDNICVVLVGTLKAGNIGAAARAMKNMGLRHLKLVAPQEMLGRMSRMMAAGAHDVLESAQVFETLGDALAEERLIVGTTSSRDRRAGRRLKTCRQAAPLIRRFALTQKTALVFGPERSGLEDAQLSRCRLLVTIPAHPDNPVLNLAQSVMIMAYELFQADLGLSQIPAPPRLAADAEREEMFRHLSQTLLRIGFFGSQNEVHMMKAFRRLLGHALTPREVRIVRALMSHIEWFAEKGRHLPEEEVRRN